MGWFDGDSSGDETGQAPAKQLSTMQQPQKQDNDDDDDDDEDDPLDAFMNSLESTVTSSSSKPKASRMDLQQEKEEESVFDMMDQSAAAAFKHSYKGGNNNNGMAADDAQGDDVFSPRNNQNSTKYTQTERAQQARQALHATFLPATAASHQTKATQPQDKDSIHAEDDNDEPINPHDWSQVGIPQLPSAAAAAASASNNSRKYAAVRKVFWNATDTSKGAAWRRENQVHCTASVDPILDFNELRSIFTENVYNTITQKQGYEQPTTVQAQTLPVALSGRDVLVTAATGQGKTLAYLWPTIVHILDQPHLSAEETGPIALVIVPTRELAQQVHKQAKILLAGDGGTCKTIIGGQGKYLLYQELKKSGGIELAVATPGRLLDVLSDTKKKNGLTLERTTVVVLDEADKMLHMGFEGQVKQILQALRPDRQTFLLSATLGRRVEQVARAWLQPDYVRIAVGKSGESSEHVEQHVMVLPDAEAKKSFLLQMIPTFQAVGRAIVFVATREGCESLAKVIRDELPNENIALDTLHGDKHQSHRTSTLRAFTKGEISILIATDVAGRGLDVPQVATVVNYDPAKNLDTHVHRVGRAGRLSKEGTQQKGSAYTLLTPKDADFAHVLRNSFVREHREVSDELERLADRSRKATGNSSTNTRKGQNRAGLGFESETSNAFPPAPPPPKRSRWN